MFAKPDLRRYRVSAAGAKWLYVVIFALASRIGSRGKLEADVQAQCSVGPPWLSRTVVQSQQQPWLCRQRARDLVQPRDKGLLEEEVVAFEQSLCRLWPVLTSHGGKLFSRRNLGDYVAFAHRLWFSVYSEIVSVLGLVLLSPLTIT